MILAYNKICKNKREIHIIFILEFYRYKKSIKIVFFELLLFLYILISLIISCNTIFFFNFFVKSFKHLHLNFGQPGEFIKILSSYFFSVFELFWNKKICTHIQTITSRQKCLRVSPIVFHQMYLIHICMYMYKDINIYSWTCI